MKQEEIRAGRAEIIIKKLIDKTSLESPEINRLADELNKEVEDYEHSQGVVIKVERELSENYQQHIDDAPQSVMRGIEMPSDLFNFYKGALRGQQDMLKAGYVAVEPLIGGEG